MNYQMPKVNRQKLASLLTDSEYAIALKVIKSDDTVRASKPTIKYDIVSEVREYSAAIRAEFPGTPRTYVDTTRWPTAETGIPAYVWRMVVFAVSKNPVHHCMPVCADFDLPREDRKEVRAQADKIVDAILDCVDPRQWHGITRWGQAFGVVGTPQYTKTGEVVYR